MKTIITNNDNETKTYGWIPPHGVTLAAQASVTLDGDIWSILGGGRNRYGRKSELAALSADRDAGHVIVEVVEEVSSSSSQPGT